MTTSDSNFFTLISKNMFKVNIQVNGKNLKIHTKNRILFFFSFGKMSSMVLTLCFIMLQNGQTYFKNLTVFTPQDFWSMFDHFATLWNKGLNSAYHRCIQNPVKLKPLTIFAHYCSLNRIIDYSHNKGFDGSFRNDYLSKQFSL